MSEASSDAVSPMCVTTGWVSGGQCKGGGRIGHSGGFERMLHYIYHSEILCKLSLDNTLMVKFLLKSRNINKINDIIKELWYKSFTKRFQKFDVVSLELAGPHASSKSNINIV